MPLTLRTTCRRFLLLSLWAALPRDSLAAPLITHPLNSAPRANNLLDGLATGFGVVLDRRVDKSADRGNRSVFRNDWRRARRF